MVEYLISILTLVAIYGILTVSLNLTYGYTGIANLGHLAFASIGAYALVIANKHFGLPFWTSVVAAVLTIGVLAAGFALLIRKISGDQLALISLFFAFTVSVVLLSWQDIVGRGIIGQIVPDGWHNLTGGALGLAGIKRPPLIANSFALLVAATAVFVGVEWLVYRIAASPFGRVLAAIRDDETAAEILGKRTAAVKIQVFVLSCVFASLGGMLFALLVRYLDPTTLYLHDLVFVLTALIIGGVATRGGPLSGVLIVFTLVESLRFVPQWLIQPQFIGPLRQIIYTGALIAILLVRPKGLFGKIDCT